MKKPRSARGTVPLPMASVRPRELDQDQHPGLPVKNEMMISSIGWSLGRVYTIEFFSMASTQLRGSPLMKASTTWKQVSLKPPMFKISDPMLGACPLV